MPTVEFADIRIRAALPLHPYLSQHSHLFLRLVADGGVCGDTAGVNGDLASGVWEFNARLYAPRVQQSLNVTVLTGVKGPGIQVISVTIKMAELLAREKTFPNRHKYILIFDSHAAIQLKLVITCSIKLSLDRVPQAVGDKGNTIHRHNKNDISDFDLAKMEPSSREDLEPIYKMTASIPDWDPRKARRLSILGDRFHALYDKERRKEDLEKAISMHEEAMQLTGPLHTHLAEYAHGFALALVKRFQQSGCHSDIEMAISHSQTAVRCTDDLEAVKPARLANLGNALRLRFERLGHQADIEEAISSLQQTVELTPDGHPYKPRRLCKLGFLLQARFKCLGNLVDLENAIASKRQAVELIPDGDPNKPGLLGNFGDALQTRFERIGDLAELEDAISLKRKAVEMTPDGHSEKPDWLNSLGNALEIRFQRLGSMVDSEDAIENYREAVAMTPDDHSEKPGRLHNLGSALLSRFERVGSHADLENAISNYRRGLEFLPDSHFDKPGLLNNLGKALSIRFNRLGSLIDLENAISNYRVAVELMPDGQYNKPMLLNGLGIALKLRFDRLGVLADLEDAISNSHQAVQLTPDGHPRKPYWLNSLGIALLMRFERLSELADLEAGMSNARQAVLLTPDGHPNKPAWVSNLGNAFIHRFRCLGILSDLESALSALSTAANSTSGPAMVRFKVACKWAKVAEEQSRSPLDAFNCAIDLLPRIAWLGLAVTDQHALLANVGGIVRDAVAAAIRYEEYETAVVWAEQGRSIVWQNLLGLRSPVDDLHETHPELADRLLSVAKQLEGSGSPLETPAASAGDVSLNYSKLAIEWDDIVAEVRRIPGFEGFLKAKGFRQLAPAAHEGPVVILNVNDAQCDALVVIADESVGRKVSALHIPLQRFSHEKSKKMFQTLTNLLSSAGVRERTDRKTGRFQSQANGEAKFKVILGILWTDVVKPVIEGLAFQIEPKQPPRIWWCATGLLAFLPIHAAGMYDAQEVGERVSDYVISSYAPTLSAVLEAPDPMVREDFQVMTVAQASAPGAQPIPKTEEEVRIIQGLANRARVLNLTGKNATVERVQEGMVESNWIHLACHGQQNPDDPMESGFLLHDKILKLSEIVKMTLPKTDFAFLSACQTAMGDEKVAEESVHLAAGMFLSGCRGVIATTWSIRDDDAPKITQEVYTRMFNGGKPNRKEAAYALHAAVKSLRESGAPCTSWVPFIHIGR